MIKVMETTINVKMTGTEDISQLKKLMKEIVEETVEKMKKDLQEWELMLDRLSK